jgi:glycosyltransferase involved in cell wall biosynthesis
MIAFLKGKRILLVSPQPWDHIPISKHHYAQVLGETNKVYFLQPPDWSLPRGVRRLHPCSAKGVEVVQWRPLTPRWLRFHAFALYARLIRLDAKRISEFIGNEIDVVWCFDFNTFPDLRAFGAGFTIFHPVDPLSSPRHVAIGHTANLILGVSQKILDAFEGKGIVAPRVVVNHGIGHEFETLARSPAPPSKGGGAVRCGYFGNLDRSIINVDLLARIARENPSVEFHFWGPAREDGSIRATLSHTPNCHFHGTVDKQELARAASKMDCFVIAYVHDSAQSDRSNAHKLLEYFATGRVIVSTRMECYREPGLMEMSRAADDSDFPEVFASVVRNIEAYNNPELMAARMKVAGAYTYEGNVASIDALIVRRWAEVDQTRGLKS